MSKASQRKLAKQRNNPNVVPKPAGVPQVQQQVRPNSAPKPAKSIAAQPVMQQRAARKR